MDNYEPSLDDKPMKDSSEERNAFGFVRQSDDPPTLVQQSRTSQQREPSKIAIPRLPRDGDGLLAVAASPVDRHRVSHACQQCRLRKTKCSGERPACKHCEEFKITCVYTDGKRDRTKKQFKNMVGKVGEYERLLRDLSLRVEPRDRMLIQNFLAEVSPEDDEATSVASSKKIKTSTIYDGTTNNSQAENHVSGRVGSIDSLDRTNEDFDHSPETRSTGFIGKTSELSWLQRLKKGLESDSKQNVDELLQNTTSGQLSPSSLDELIGPEMYPISQLTYHCDDLPISISDEVDQYEMPQKEIAYLLFQSYLDTVHPEFPIIGKTTFSSQFETHYEHLRARNHDWLAILNMVFAIGARYSHLTQAPWRGDERDHLIYFTRARMLGHGTDAILDPPSMQRIQIAGLLAFYLISVNQIGRAWSVCGVAIRHATALGLNLMNMSKTVSDPSKEIRVRVWWALCSIDRLLAVMTGRAASYIPGDCAAPLPLPFDEDVFFSGRNTASYVPELYPLLNASSHEPQPSENSLTPSSSSSVTRLTPPTASFQPTLDIRKDIPPSQSLCFFHLTKLSTITVEIINRLYRSRSLSHSWAHLQSLISLFESKIDEWRSALSPSLDFTTDHHDQQFARQRMSLGFAYYSTLLIATRPCLCRVNRKIPDASDRALGFNTVTAQICVRAAMGMLKLLPKEPNVIGIYRISPWWCLVHHLMQAGTVLLLELSFHAEHLPQEMEEIWELAKKVLHWLRNMSEEVLAAKRGWLLYDDMIRKVAQNIGRNIDDLPSPNVVSSQTFPHGVTDDFPKDTSHTFSDMAFYPSPFLMNHMEDTSVKADTYLPDNMDYLYQQSNEPLFSSNSYGLYENFGASQTPASDPLDFAALSPLLDQMNPPLPDDIEKNPVSFSSNG